MMDIEVTAQARDMMQERGIAEEWVWRALRSPDRSALGAEGNMQYVKAIPERGGRFLRVVVNDRVVPAHIVTLFFDRRLGGRYEAQD